MSFDEVVFCMKMVVSRTSFHLQTNSDDPDQTSHLKEQSDLGPHCVL